MEKILSLLIPSYNMEKYLQYCLDSLLIKDNIELIEVLVINDGSRDKTLEIAKTYESRYPEMFKVVDKPNGNYGSCINRGLQEATGKYVKILDADDSFDTENFNEFVKFLLSHDADLIISDFVTVNEDRAVTNKYEYKFGVVACRLEDICNSSRFLSMEMHAVTYRLELLRENHYIQTEGISYTDQQWIFEPMAYVADVCIFNKFVYKYLVGRDGQTMNSDIMVKKIPDRIKMTLDIVSHYNDISKNQPDAIAEYLLTRARLNLYQIYSGYFFNRKRINRVEILEFDKALRDADEKLYYVMAKHNKQVRYWRLISRSRILDRIYCACFSSLFKILRK